MSCVRVRTVVALQLIYAAYGVQEECIQKYLKNTLLQYRTVTAPV